MKRQFFSLLFCLLAASCSTLTAKNLERQPQAFLQSARCDADPYAGRKSGSGPEPFRYCEGSLQLANPGSDVCMQVECIDKSSGWGLFLDGSNLDQPCRLQVNDEAAEKTKLIYGNKNFIFCQKGKYGSKDWTIRANAVLQPKQEDQALANGFTVLSSVVKVRCSNELALPAILIKKSQSGEGRYYVDSQTQDAKRIYLDVVEDESATAFHSVGLEKFEMVISKSRDQAALKLDENLIFSPGAFKLETPPESPVIDAETQKNIEEAKQKNINLMQLKPSLVQLVTKNGAKAFYSECKLLK